MILFIIVVLVIVCAIGHSGPYSVGWQMILHLPFWVGFLVGLVCGVLLLTGLYIASDSEPEEWKQ